MNHEFCMSCGHKASFPVTKPKFCPNCGTPFNTSLGSVKKVSREEPEEEERELDVDSIDIDRLRKQVSIESFGHKTTLNDLWSSPAPSDGTRRVAYAGAGANDILKQIKNECSPVTRTLEVGE